MEITGQPLYLGVYVVNPLRAEGDTFEALYKYRDKIGIYSLAICR